ncbi:MAG: DNA polymerase III subunit delta' [Ignavibacteriae bacterium]|nr:DNA polymerase III subunit delta' [Ignavibacteriota bacterium]
MSWNTVIGQERVKNQITTILEQNRLAHAYLFTGPDGVGKDASAIELAKIVNCEKQKSVACDKCSSCLQVISLQHPNIHLIFSLPAGKGETSEDSPIEKLSNDDIHALQEQIELKSKNLYYDIVVAKANSIKVNSIRELRRKSSMSTLTNGKKVFIILDAENLREESANAMLKTLEEPQANTLIILTSSHSDQLKPTIISRCQLVKFDYISEEEIKSALIKNKEMKEVEAESIARMANGSYARALELLESDFLEMRKLAVDVLRTMLYRSKEDLFKLIEQITMQYERHDVERLFGLMQSWLRDSMSLHSGNERIVNVDDEAAIKKFSAVHSNVQYGNVFESLEKSVSLLNKNVYIPLVMLNLTADLQQHILKPNLKPRN